MKELFKIQISLFDSEGQTSILIYNKDRSIYQQLFDKKSIKAVKQLLKNRVKGYFEGYVDQNGLVQLDSIEKPDPGW